MTSSKPTSGKYTVDEVKLAWTDMGNKMFKVRLSREDGTEWETRTWAKDEMDAYLIATRQYEEGAD